LKQRCLQIAAAFAFIKRRGKALLISNCGNYRSIACIVRISAQRRDARGASCKFIVYVISAFTRACDDFNYSYAQRACSRSESSDPANYSSIDGDLETTSRSRGDVDLDVRARISESFPSRARAFRSFSNRRSPEIERSVEYIYIYLFVLPRHAESHFGDSASISTDGQTDGSLSFSIRAPLGPSGASERMTPRLARELE